MGEKRRKRERGSTHSEDSDEDEKRKLEVVPVSIVRDLEEDELPGPVWVHGLRKEPTGQHETKEREPRVSNSPKE